MSIRKVTNTIAEWRNTESSNPKGTATITMDYRYLLVKTRKRSYLFDLLDRDLMGALCMHSPLLFNSLFVDKEFVVQSGFTLRRQWTKFIEHPKSDDVTVVRTDHPAYPRLMISYNSVKELEEADFDVLRNYNQRCGIRAQVFSKVKTNDKEIQFYRDYYSDFEILRTPKPIDGIDYSVSVLANGQPQYYYGLEEFIYEAFSIYNTEETQ